MPPKSKTQQRKAKKLDQKLAETGLQDKDGAEQVQESFKEKGNKAFVLQKYEEALDFYTMAIEEDSKNHINFSNRAAANLALRRFAEALQDAEKSIALNPAWHKAYLRKGEALEGLLQYPEAVYAYKAGLEKAPEDPNIKKNLELLMKLLEELKISEQQISNANNPEADKFETMIKWMKDGGSKFPLLYMQYYSEDYRGVHALSRVANNQVILFVPLSHIMTSEVAKASDIGKKIISSGVELRSKHSYLAAYLLQEKHRGRNSFWFPYINMLPEKYRNMPIFFQPEELQMLKGSFTYDKIEDRKDSLRREYEAIKRAVPEFGDYTLQEFIWARLVVITRIFGLVVKGQKTDGLVPYADMLNHMRPREGQPGDTKWSYEDSYGGFVITSLRTMQRGEEIHDSYGRKCNSRFFVNYGFTLDENEDNEVVVRLSLPKDDPHYQMKVNYLGGREANANREFQIPASYREKKTREMFSFLRFVHAKGPELLALPPDGMKFARHSYEDDEEIEELEPMSVSNEIAVLKHLTQSCQAVLSGFETSLEDDKKVLAKPRNELDNNVRNCLVMRAGEKQVLHWYIDLAKNAIPLLQMPWKDLKKIAAKSAQGSTAFDHYVTAVVVPLAKKQG